MEVFKIFTRDFDQWVNQMVRDVLVEDVPSAWGRGLQDQLTRFTGRTFEWYRFVDDFAAFQQHVVSKPLDDPIFQQELHDAYCKDIDTLRALLAEQDIENPVKHLHQIKETFRRMYPLYALGVFLPGAWREPFLAIHGGEGEEIIERVHHSREHSEGVLKETGLHLRQWLGPQFDAVGSSKSYVKVCSVEELEAFVASGALPKDLEERYKGFAYIGGKILNTTDFEGVLAEHDITLQQQESLPEAELKGTVACKGGVITGKVSTVFNTHEVAHFVPGSILVTPMTSPEYLPAIKQAAAIVTDEGSLACHAAITSRELGIPCVMSTKSATKLFHNGDTVEVDTETGVVRGI